MSPREPSDAPSGGEFPTPSYDDWRRAAEKALRGKPLESVTWRTEDGFEIPPVVPEAEVAGVARAPRDVSIAVSVFSFDADDGLAERARESLERDADLVHVQATHLILADAIRDLPGERVLVSSWAASKQPYVWFAAAAKGDVNGVVADGSDASVSPVTQIAETLLGALELLQDVVAESGLTPGRAARALVIPVSVGPEVLTEVSKLRALRAQWSRLAEHVQIPREDAAATRFLASPAEYHLTRFEPENNVLRSTLAAFAAICGGADIVEIHGYDGPVVSTLRESTRLAVNQARLMLHESHLGRVDDPFAGAPLVEQLTGQLIDASWDLMESLDQEPTEELVRAADASAAEASRRRWDAVVRRERVIVGINRFADPSRDREVPPLDFAYGNGDDSETDYAALRADAILDAAQPFEWLRDRVLEHIEGGTEPVALIVGPVSGRAAGRFAADLFRCAGFNIHAPDCGESPAEVAAAISESLFDYDVLVVHGDDDVARAVETVTELPYYRVGRDGADSDRVIARVHTGIDAVELLSDALDRAGVARIP